MCGWKGGFCQTLSRACPATQLLPRHTELQIREGPKRTSRAATEGAALRGTGPSARLVTQGEGKGPPARGAVSRRPRPACPRRPLVPSAMTCGRSRKETAPEHGGGVVSRQCSYHYCRSLPADPSTPSMSGLRVYSTSVTGSREVSVRPDWRWWGRAQGCVPVFWTLAPGTRPHDGGEVLGTVSRIRSRGPILSVFIGYPGSFAAAA